MAHRFDKLALLMASSSLLGAAACVVGPAGRDTAITVTRVAPEASARPLEHVVVRLDGMHTWLPVGPSSTKDVRLEEGPHVLTVSLLSTSLANVANPNRPSDARYTEQVSIDGLPAEIHVDVVCAPTCEARFRASKAVRLGPGTMELFRFGDPAMIALRERQGVALARGEAVRATCISKSLGDLFDFEVRRDLDPLSNEWSVRHTHQDIDQAAACTNDVPPSTDPCALDPSICEPVVDQ